VIFRNCQWQQGWRKCKRLGIEDALTLDPDTGVPVERVLHPPAVHFKGKGFYNTDYGTRNRQRETAAAEASSKDSSSKDSSSKDSSSKDSSSGGSSSASDSKDSSSAGSAAGEKSSKDSANSKGSKPVAAKS